MYPSAIELALYSVASCPGSHNLFAGNRKGRFRVYFPRWKPKNYFSFLSDVVLVDGCLPTHLNGYYYQSYRVVGLRW